MTNLFVYGSLMSPRVLAHVIGHAHSNVVPAKAKGFHRFCIKERSYPALCRVSSSSFVGGSVNDTVEGMLVMGLSDKDIQILDDFEGEDYVRTAIKVTLADGKTQVDTFTYLWAKGNTDSLLHGEWSFERDFVPKEDETLRLWGFIS
jgi:gamma-glutamylcyclotransferase (GGCT)/AIG2-like uncharacterized protein YtfP